MQIGPLTLDGHHVRLEPISLAHVPTLWHAGAHEEIWRYLPYTMRSEEDMRAYVASELAKQEAGLVVRFVTVAKAIAQPVGSTRSISASPTTNGLASRRISKGSWPRTRPHPLGFPPRPPGNGKGERLGGFQKSLLCYPMLVEGDRARRGQLVSA
jgi:hypothetical protein